MSDQHRFSTRAVHRGEQAPKPFHALTTPIIQTSTFTFTDTDDLIEYKLALNDRIEYGRYGNPTIRAAEAKLADLDGGADAVLFASGMAATTLTLLGLLNSGDHLIITDDCYRRTRQFVTDFLPSYGISHSQVPMGDYEALEEAIRPETRLIFSESPTNPYLRVADLERLVEIGRRHQILTLVDSTFATPVNQRPLEFGIDLVIHSATKYLSGHNDILAGVAIGPAELVDKIREVQNMVGAISDPNSAYLLLRGIKTLDLRVHHQNRSALEVARFLEDHPRVSRVYYPGLASHPQHETARTQMSGFGGVVSFELAGNLGSAGRFIDALRIPAIGPSFGGVESLVIQVAVATYYDLTPEERAAIGISDTLVRFAVGVEDPTDLINDLKHALTHS